MNLSGTVDILSLGQMAVGDTVTIIHSATRYSNSGGVTVLVDGVHQPPTPVAPDVYEFTWNENTYELSLVGGADGNDAVLTMLSGAAPTIPEPGAWALMAGGGVLLALEGRRRRMRGRADTP